MTGALKFEWVRIKTIRSSYWMSAMAILFSAGITTILAIFVTSADVDDTDVAQVTTWMEQAGMLRPSDSDLQTLSRPRAWAPFVLVIGVTTPNRLR